MIGIFVGVWALIVVLSVMNGFQKEVRTRILGVASHVQISSIDNRLPDWRSIAALAAQQPRVLATAPFVQGQAMLAAGPAAGRRPGPRPPPRGEGEGGRHRPPQPR